MQNVYHNKNCNAGLVHLQVDPSPTLLIKSKHNDKLEMDFVILKLRRDPTSENLDLYEFKMTFSKMAIWNIFCCLFITSTWLSRHQERWGRPRRWNNFVRLFVEKCYVSLTCCLLTCALGYHMITHPKRVHGPVHPPQGILSFIYQSKKLIQESQKKEMLLWKMTPNLQ